MVKVYSDILSCNVRGSSHEECNFLNGVSMYMRVYTCVCDSCRFQCSVSSVLLSRRAARVCEASFVGARGDYARGSVA